MKGFDQMENQKINQIVKNTKKEYKNIIHDYLSKQVKNIKFALSHKDKYSKVGIYIMKRLYKTRSLALEDFEMKPESQFDHNDWSQAMNITNLYYTHAKMQKDPQLIKVAKAHFNYCCRYYIKTAAKGHKDKCLQVIYTLNKWNQHPGKEMKEAKNILKK